MDIRLATLADARAIAEIHVRSWQVAYADLIPEAYLQSLSVDRREAVWREILSGGSANTWIAEDDGHALGWVSAGPSRESDAGPEAGELWALYVHPEAWRRGVGQALWETAHAALVVAGFTHVTLWVLAGNERARGFYEANGFRVDAGHEQTTERGGVVLREIRMQADLR